MEIQTESKILAAAEKKAMIRNGLKQGNEASKRARVLEKHSEYKQVMKNAAPIHKEKIMKEVAAKSALAVEKNASAKLMKMGKVGTTIGVGAAIIAGLNKNKGKQTNSQLYGQKGY